MPIQTRYTCRIELLGEFRIVSNGCIAARFQTHKTGALLAYLAFYRDRVHAREELMELLWPEVEPTTGRNRLKQTLSALRMDLQAAGVPAAAILRSDRATVRLNAGEVTTDLAEFEAACRRAARAAASAKRSALLAQAIQAYGGILLPGFYDDWVVTERARLAQAHVEALLQLAQLLEQAGDLNQAIEHARRAAAADSLREETHCVLMRLYAAQGRSADAIRQYREMERSLQEQLNERPSAETQRLFQAIQEGRIETVAALQQPAAMLARPCVVPAHFEPVGGAMPLSSEYYIVRATDREFAEAIARRDSIVLVKGPRQIGKTSLLARGLQQAREAGARVVLTDLQRLTAEQLGSANALFLTLADTIIEQIELNVSIKDIWDPERGWNVNFERFLRREALGTTDSPLIWGLDEVDRLFPCDFSAEVFGLFRSWHNLRALHPDGPWSRLTLAMAYATEAHLFISDLNQSPFNVGTRLALQDFTLEQVTELNLRYGSPLKDTEELLRYFALIGGSPYLVRRGLHEMVTQQRDLPGFEAAARQEEGPFRDHLRQMLLLVSQDAALSDAVRESLQTGACTDAESFYRLRSAGVLDGEMQSARFRCQLYADYFKRRLT